MEYTRRVEYDLEAYLGYGKNHCGLGVGMDHGIDVRPVPINRTVDDSFPMGPERVFRQYVAFLIQLQNILFRYRCRGNSTGHEIGFRIFRISHTHMAQVIKNTLVGENPVRPDNMIDCLLSGFRVLHV